MSIKPILFILLAASLTACDDIFKDGDKNDLNCTAVLCTEDFRMLSITLKDEAGNPVVTDDVEVYYTKSKESLNLDENLILMEEGVYIIATDAQMEDIDPEGTSITFEAHTDSKTTFSKKFEVGRDCCHIERLDKGDSEFVL